MKTFITSNLLKFCATAVVLTIAFRYALSTSIANHWILAVVCTALFYSIFMWFTGKYFGIREYEQLPIFDVGFRFHCATFVTHNLVSILWFFYGSPSKYEEISITYTIAIIWSILLMAHFIYFLSTRKSSIHNLDKHDLFE